MREGTRRAVVYIVGRAIGGGEASSVYDQSVGQHFMFSGNVTNNINVYDYSRSCHIAGNRQQVYDYGISAHISMDIQGETVKGYDHGTGSHYQATVLGRTVNLYDYSSGRYYHFTF